MKRFNIAEFVHANWYVVLIILCGAFLRLYRLPDFAMFLADQGRDALVIRQIATLQHFPLIGPPSSIGQVYLGPFFYYLMAPFLLLALFHPIGITLGGALLWIVAIAVSYYLVRKIVGKTESLVYLLFITFSYQLILSSRFAWNPNLLPVFSFISLTFLYLGIKKNNIRYSMLFGVFYGLSFQLHHLAALLIAPAICAFIYWMVIEKNKMRVIMHGLISIAGFFVTSAPFVLFELKHNFLNMKNLSSLFQHQNFVAGGSPLSRLLDTNHAFYTHILSFQFPMAFSTCFSLLIILLSIIAYIQKNKRNEILFILIHAISFFSFIYCFSLISSPHHPHYYGTVYLSFFLLVSYLLTTFTKNNKILLLFFIVPFIVINAKSYDFIFSPSQNQMQHAKTVADSVLQHMDGDNFNYATYPTDFTSEDSYVYFLVLNGKKPANREKNEITNQMFVFCNKQPCKVLDSGSWNIAMFGEAKIDTMWTTDGIYVYKLIHP